MLSVCVCFFLPVLPPRGKHHDFIDGEIHGVEYGSVRILQHQSPTINRLNIYPMIS
jgi:hypothetical protein